MANSGYLTAPVASNEMPKGIPYIVSNEAAERFSFYGMKSILIIFMTKYLLDATGQKDVMGAEEAKGYYHLFTSAVYFTPLLGAIIADAFFGKYRTILSLSIVYCAGHLCLALDETRLGLALGLGLIALGSGGIKPCVSAHVGDQFGKSNQHLLAKVFMLFYFSINLGSAVSTLATPWLLAEYGPHVAFGVPGVLMGLATLFFWMGRNVFIHIPAGGIEFLKEMFSATGLRSLARLFVLYVFVAMFWALFDQTGSAWVLQADRMDRNFLGFEWFPSQIQAVNPIMIMILIPVFSGVKFIGWPGLYKLIDRIYPLTNLRKIGIGFFLTVPAFLLPAWIEAQLEAGIFVNIAWQLLAYLIMTIAEVFVSITCLEFSYTQAPRNMKSLIMACFMVSISLGNIFVAGVNFFIQEAGPTFHPDAEGRYHFEMSVSDGEQTATQSFTVTALSANPPHVRKQAADELKAEAGRLVAVKPGEEVRMYGTVDPGDARGEWSYSWSFASVPEGTQIDSMSLKYADTRNPTFVPDVVGDYELEFHFRVGKPEVEQESRDRVVVRATNTNAAPIVNVSDITWSFDEGAPVSLDGSASFDPDGDELIVQWRLLEKPELSQRRVTDITNADRIGASSKLAGASYYYFFAICMLVTAVLFIPVAMMYKGKTYIQDENAMQD
jgi:POT family proton-dependent oligopeptide transporter